VPRTRILPIGHDERLTLVDHLAELRSRLILCAAGFGVAFAVTVWQNHRVLDIVNRPLPADTPKPITFGVTEPFTTTLTNAAYFAILIALPFVLYQIYAFVLPAFSPKERKVATPLMVMAPALFVAGVVFCYFVVLPPAIKILLNFNSSEFNTQVRARDYYSFVTLTMVAMGLGFQVPIAILAAVRVGLTSPEALRRNRRYAVLVIAVVAALLPTIDPVSLILEMIPMLLLYEFSILLAVWVGRQGEAAPKAPPAEASSAEAS
jgi:sec-independent protein translocase protein TatC